MGEARRRVCWQTFAVMGRFVGVVLVSVFGCGGQALESAAPVLPILEVSLAPPVDPLPEVSKQTGDVERRVDATMEAGLALVKQAYVRAVKDARARVSGIVDRAMETAKLDVVPTSFLAAGLAPGDVASVTVRVSDGLKRLPTVHGNVAALGQSIVRAESSFFEEVAKDMSRVSDQIADKLRVELHQQLEAAAGRGVSLPASAGFLAVPELPRQLTVRSVVSDVPYASAASMVRDMSLRSSATEKLAVTSALNMLAQLVQTENALIQAKFQSIGRSH